MKTSLKFLIVLLSMALATAACGGETADRQEYVDAIATVMTAEGDVPEGVDIDCMAGAMFDGLGGAEGLESDLGLTLEDIQAGDSPDDDLELSRDAALALTDEMMGCDLSEALVSEIASDFDEESARCLVGELDQDIVRDMMAAQFMNPTDGAAAEAAAEAELLPSMFEAMSTCEISLDQLGN